MCFCMSLADYFLYLEATVTADLCSKSTAVAMKCTIRTWELAMRWQVFCCMMVLTAGRRLATTGFLWQSITNNTQQPSPPHNTFHVRAQLFQSLE
jgi:hypothetical protein